MKITFFIKTISILVVFSTLIFPFSGFPVFAQDELYNNILYSSFGTMQLPTGISDTDFWVVRVYFDSRQQVNDLAAWIEPWEVNYEEGFLVIGVDANAYDLLLAQGYRVEVDQAATESFDRPMENLPGQVNGIPGYPCYRTVEETYAAAAEIAANHPQLATWLDIGNSWEKYAPGGSNGYDIKVLRLTNSETSGDKPKLFVMTAVHAREYATAELNTRFAEYLISNYDIDPDVTWLLDYTEIHLLLIANPDGRKHAEEGVYWRKNTNENYCSPTSNYRGADLNRNFEFQWGCCNGSSVDECSEVYRGPSAASEPEVWAIQNYVDSIFPDQRVDNINSPAPSDATGVFLDIHSYGELVIWPWGFTGSDAPNGQALQTLGRKFAYFNGYDPAQAYDLYPTDGTTDDFAYGELGLAAYTFELGTTFFQGCSHFENTILPDNLTAMLYAAKISRTPYLTPAGPDAINVNAVPITITAGDIITLSATIDDTRYNNKNGAEAAQSIAAAEYYLDVPPWMAGATGNQMLAADGAFDSSREDVFASVEISNLSDGRHIVYLRGQDADGNWGAVSAIFIPSVFSIEKSTSAFEVTPNEFFTYTLEANLTLTDTHTFSLALTDTLPTEVSVLTDSIQVNGVPAPEIYLTGTDILQYISSGTFTDTHMIEIQFQVQANSDVISGTLITNQLHGQASIDGLPLDSPIQVEVITQVTLPVAQHKLFLPVIVR